MMEGIGEDLWREFLKNVKKLRPRYPINGVLVTVPVDQLCDPCNYRAEGEQQAETKSSYNIFCREMTREEENSIRQKAENIRIRLQELSRELRFEIPIYLVLSKCDLIEGFHSFKKVLLEGIGEENKILEQSLSTNLTNLFKR